VRIAGGIIERDPVTFEVVRSGLYAICAEMKAVIMRTSFSPLLSLSADLSCALLDAQGRVVAQGNDIPFHLGAVPFTVRAALDAFPADEWKEGDGVLLNDPYAGGTHLPDMSLIMPVCLDEQLIGFSLSRVHWPDVGGIAPGSSTVTDHILKEGIRIPPIKIIEDGVVRRDIIGLILANVRVPEDRYGDFRAQVAGARRSEIRLREIAQRYGIEIVAEVMRYTQIYSRHLVEQRLMDLADAKVQQEERLDGDGVDHAARPVICVALTKKGSTLVVDFTGSSPCVSGPVNAPLAVTASAVYYVLMCLAGGDIPPNEGVYALAELIAPAGTIVNATPPFPVVAANTETSNRIVDVILSALARAYPDRVPAGSYGSACVYTLGGFDPYRQRAFVHYETIGGGMGAHRLGDGANGVRVHMGNTMNLPVEAIEAAIPVRFHVYEILHDNGGSGARRGGAGVKKMFEALADGLQVSILGERTASPAHGVLGGDGFVCEICSQAAERHDSRVAGKERTAHAHAW